MSMKYIAAYALASLAKPSPSEADVEKICRSVGIDVDAETLSFVLESINNRDVATLIAEGASKMSSMSAAGAVSSGAAAPAAAAGSAPAAAAADAGKAKKEEPAEEEDDDMGFGLFD